MSDRHCLDVLAAYCLDAVEPDERVEIMSHLARCAYCRTEAASVADCLHTTFGEDCATAKPDPDLRTRFLARVALERQPSAADTAPARPAPLVEAPPRPNTPFMRAGAGRNTPMMRWLLAAAVAIPTLLAALFAAAWVGMNHQYADVKSQYDGQQAHLLEQALASPHVAMPLKGPATNRGMVGEVIVPKSSGGGLLIISGMSKPPNNMGYTCWIRRDGQWTFYGPLVPDASRLAMFVMDSGKGMDPHGASMMEITLEPMNQTLTAPSAPMLLSTPL
jgi:hypothetical protein